MRVSLIITFTCLRSSAPKIFKSWGSAESVCLSVRSADGRWEFTGNYRKKKLGKKKRAQLLFPVASLMKPSASQALFSPSFLPSSAGGRREEELVGLARQATCLRNTFPLLVFKDTGFKLQKTSRTVWESASDQERFRKRAAAVCQCWRTITVQSESESARTATTRKDTGQLGCNYKHGFRADVHCLPREHTKWCTMSGCKFFFKKKKEKTRKERWKTYIRNVRSMYSHSMMAHSCCLVVTVLKSVGEN